MNKHTKQEILKNLRSISVMSISAVLDNLPIASIVLFAVDDDFTFYFAAGEYSYKARALRKNSAISLAVWEHYKFHIQATGKAEIITNPKEAEKALDKIVSATGNIKDFWPPIFAVTEDDYVIFKVTADWIRMQDLTMPFIKAPQPPYSEYQLHKAFFPL